MWLKRNECGLTLVEVLVAAVILGIIAVGLFATFDVGARLTAAARQQTKAVNLAQGKLEELQLISYDDLDYVNAPRGTAFDPPVAGFTYGVAVQGPNAYGTKSVTVTVYYPVGNREEEVTLFTERSNLSTEE